MQTATSETESKSRDLSIYVHHYTLRAPCPKGQGNYVPFHSFDERSKYTTPLIHPPLAPTAATPRLHSKYQSPGTHLRETVRRRAPRGQIVDCGCVEDEQMSGWSQ